MAFGLSVDAVTLGSPLAFVIENTDAKSKDYEHLKHVFRPNHADYTYQARYGVRDYRGGGRASARVTAPWVVAGAVAMQLLSEKGVKVSAYTSSIACVALPGELCGFYEDKDVYASAVRCPDEVTSRKMAQEIEAVQRMKDTVGGVVSCIVKGFPAGIGDPVFGKLQAKLANAMMSINAAKGFEYGDGFAASRDYGSHQTDKFEIVKGKIETTSNHSGGIQGGISNGADINFRVAFKPVATMMRPIETISETGQPCVLEPSGRHDVCVVPRAVPIVQALAALVLCDSMLTSSISIE